MDKLRTEIAIFGFNRPEKLKACLESLSRNIESSTYILNVFIDGPRNESEMALTERCANLFDYEWNFRKIRLEKHDYNLGLAESIIKGVTKVLESADSVIVLEDDLVVSPLFLKFMQSSLNKYCSENRVVSIHGYSLPGVGKGDECYFLKGADCWGWATWGDRWEKVNWNTSDLIAQLTFGDKALKFDLDGTANYTDMLHQQLRSEIDSWAIRWHASAFIESKLTLYPAVSFVKNLGTDGSGTHGKSIAYAVDSFATRLPNFPIEIEELDETRERLKLFYKKTLRKNSWRLVAWADRLINRVISVLKED